MGCDVEPSKSETIFSTQIIEQPDVDSRFKTMFKWLGYWLELKKNGILWLNEEEVDKKLNSQEYFARLIFQYSESTAYRWKIWKTYFSPFVELYLPAVFQKNFGARTRVHTFQHRITCWALGLCESASVERLQCATGEPSVEFKARRAAHRLLNCTGNRFDFNIKRTSTRATAPADRPLRVTPHTCAPTFTAAERKDLTFRMNLFIQEDWQEHKHHKFNIAEVKKFAQRENKKIKARAARGWADADS